MKLDTQQGRIDYFQKYYDKDYDNYRPYDDAEEIFMDLMDGGGSRRNQPHTRNGARIPRMARRRFLLREGLRSVPA